MFARHSYYSRHPAMLSPHAPHYLMTVGFSYGAGAETLIFVTGTSGKYPKLFVSRQKNQNHLWIPRKPRKIGVWVSGAEIQTSAVDTRTAVWVSTAEKFSKSFWEKLGNVLESLGVSQRQLCIKTRPLFKHGVQGLVVSASLTAMIEVGLGKASLASQIRSKIQEAMLWLNCFEDNIW